MRLFDKLFLTNVYFTIALRSKKETHDNQEWFFIPANKNRWFADPMIAKYNGKGYLFCEAAEGMHGHIEVAEINNDGSIGGLTTILSDEHHYSYPFVFSYNDEWYMIPESSDRSEVCIYRASDFPYKWEKECILLNDKAADTTLFEYHEKFSLLTYLINGVNEAVIQKAYELDMESRSIVRKLEWINPDGLRTRGAGLIFSVDNKLYRPAQLNREQSYGDGVLIYEIKQCDFCYSETEHKEMEQVSSKIRGKVITGMHTYTVSEHFEAIDVRVKDIDFFKIPKELLGLL